MTEPYQLTVIGGGPGGYTAALRGAALGLKTLLVEKENLGGTCLHHGCIPTKVLTHSASFYRAIKDAGKFGISTGEVSFSFRKIQERKAAVLTQLTAGLAGLLKNAQVDVLFGQARILSSSRVMVKLNNSGEEKEINTAKLILAFGGEDLRPSFPGMDLPGVITSREVLGLDHVPASLAIIGGGVIGLEMAAVFSAFGSSVTVVECSERLLRQLDLEMVRRLNMYLRRQGIKILLNTAVKKIAEHPEGLTLNVAGRDGEDTFSVEKVLVSVGRKPSQGGQDLASLNIDYGPRGITVQESMGTSLPHVYAVGDAVAPNYFLAHVAAHQGIVAAENAAGLKTVFKGDVVPMCLFTYPELASTGLTEEAAREKGYKIRVSKFNFAANGKAVSQGEGEGVVKIIANAREGTLLGVHILGPHASDLIQEGTLAVAKGLKAADLAELIHPHPTLSEALWEASLFLSK